MSDIEFTTLLREKKVGQPVIFQKIDELCLNETITTVAKNIYRRLQIKATRRDPQSQVLFYCVYQAYKQKKIVMDPITLANKIGIDPTKINKALSINVKRSRFPPATTVPPATIIFNIPGQSPHQRTIAHGMTYSSGHPSMVSSSIIGYSPEEYIDYYHRHTQLNRRLLESIKELCRELIKKDSDLEDNPPQFIAAAIIWYFMEINGVTINIDSFLSEIKLKKNKVRPIYQSVQHIDNS